MDTNKATVLGCGEDSVLERGAVSARSRVADSGEVTWHEREGDDQGGGGRCGEDSILKRGAVSVHSRGGNHGGMSMGIGVYWS